jgi:2-desacetyl-2-hydroxyethyl bacteriochlorophyllide A dehydrogenase
MKAIRLLRPGQPLEAQELPLPPFGPADALVRVKAAGICHSDAHYRRGTSPAYPLPLTLGHEVAGIIETVGSEVTRFQPGNRVCLHYLITCGSCSFCLGGKEQFCASAAMIGKHRDGGYAEFIVVPAKNLVLLPEDVPFEHGAVLMCSSATALHALKKARLEPGESVAVFGLGGLGISAIQLAKALRASHVFGVDLKAAKLELADSFGAVPVDAAKADPVQGILRLTAGRGVNVALELIGLPLTMRQAIRSLAPHGRAALAGITDESFEISPYQELLNKEAEIIGVSDHLLQELPGLVEWARQGKLDLAKVVTRTVPLDATAVNETLDNLERFGEDIRVVITP